MDLYYGIVFYSFLLPSVMAAILFFSGYYNRNSNLILLLSLSSVFFESLSFYLAVNSIHTTFLVHLSLCTDAILFMAFFQSNVIVHRTKLFAFFLIDLFVIICFFEALIGGIHSRPIFANSAIHIGVICMVLYYYYEVFRYEHIENLSSNSSFWINSMYLLFFSGTFAYNMFVQNNLDAGFSFKIDLVNWILLIVFNLVFTLAIWLGRIRRISN